MNNQICNRYNPRFKFLDEILTYENTNNIIENIIENNNAEDNSAQRELPENNNINNENLNQLDINDINIQIQKNNSLSTEDKSNISKQE